MKRDLDNTLRRLRPLIVRRGTTDAKVAYNALMSAVKGRRFDTCDARYGYGPSARSAVEAADFAAMARQYHRKNAIEVKFQRPSGLLNQ
jgi:hypothetical protein